MKIKTSELSGAALEWAVSIVEAQEDPTAIPPIILPMKTGFRVWSNWTQRTSNYSTNWSQGGPIIEREGIAIERNKVTPKQWTASVKGWFRYDGDTHLVAAMRCYVAAKLGAEIGVPEELV